VPFLRDGRKDVEPDVPVDRSHRGREATEPTTPPQPPPALEGWGGGASDPVQVPLSERRLSAMHLEFIGWVRRFRHWRKPELAESESLVLIANRLWHGDTNPAVVLTTKPLVIAAFSWDLDAVVLLTTAQQSLVEEFHLRPGSRLISANTYGHWTDDEGREVDAPDIVAGPESTGEWSNFFPLIADFYTDRPDILAQHAARIEDSEWQRVEALGHEALERSGGRGRLLHPCLGWLPATLLDS
jgi:hypothetical protein